jgi:hypothetical protein
MSWKLLLGLWPGLAVAAPQFVGHQGRLLDASGQPVNGALSTTFRLVNAADVTRFTQTTSVTYEDGFYAVQLGAIDSDLLAENLIVEVEIGGNELGRQSLMSAPYALAVDGIVRVSDAPASCSGLAGQLRYNAGQLEVCDGTNYGPVAPRTGLVQYKYSQTTASGSLNPIPWDNSIPQISEGGAIAIVTITPKSVGNLLVLEGLAVWVEPANHSNMFTLALFKQGQSDALAAVGDSSHNDTGGCGYTPSYPYVCTTPIRFVATATSTSPHTFELRGGLDSGAVFINKGANGWTQGNSLTSGLWISEITP